MTKHIGRHAYRFNDNPEEERFARAWAKLNDNDDLFLSGLLRGQESRSTKEECLTAATLIQWLGSPVGQHFLDRLGYEKKPAEKHAKARLRKAAR